MHSVVINQVHMYSLMESNASAIYFFDVFVLLSFT